MTCAFCVAPDPTATVTAFPAMPPVPLQAKVYVVVANGETTWDPLTTLAPVHPPKAVQLFASVDDQLSVVDCPGAIDSGAASKLRVGAEVGASVKLEVGAEVGVAVELGMGGEVGVAVEVIAGGDAGVSVDPMVGSDAGVAGVWKYSTGDCADAVDSLKVVIAHRY